MTRLSAIGADIEVIAYNSQGKNISVIDKIFGTKNRPEILPNGGGLQYDNVLAEYNIPASFSANEFARNIFQTHIEVESRLNSLALFAKYDASGFFDPDQINHPLAQLIGCAMDYNAWTQSPNVKPEFNIPGFRTCGGHVHFSWEVDSIPQSPRKEMIFVKDLHTKVQKVIRILDYTLGIPSLFLDADTARRSLYGKAGAYRIKSYSPTHVGGEYRTLSNFWADPKYGNALTEWVYNTTATAVNDTDSLCKEIPTDIEQVINSYDVKKAASYLHNLEVPGL